MLKGLLLSAGVLSLALGVIGIFLPLLPTTPFLLLSAACFSRSSPRLHQWLLTHPRLGPFIRNYQDHRAMSLKAKVLSLSVFWVVMGYTMILALERKPLVAALLLVGIGVSTYILRLKTLAGGNAGLGGPLKLLLLLSLMLAAPGLRALETVFRPEGSEFSVRFPDKPFISTSKDTDADGNPLTLSKAELSLSKPACFLRAEVTRYAPGSADSLTKEDIVSRVRTYADSTGIESPEISVAKSKLGRCATLKGTKTIGGTQSTYENKMCYGHRSMIVLYTGSATKDFPPEPALAFFKSLERPHGGNPVQKSVDTKDRSGLK